MAAFEDANQVEVKPPFVPSCPIIKMFGFIESEALAFAQAPELSAQDMLVRKGFDGADLYTAATSAEECSRCALPPAKGCSFGSKLSEFYEDGVEELLEDE